MSLGLLRKGDFRGNLAQATAMEPAVARAPVTIVCTGTYWRNAWKYAARTYRHFGWDGGTLLANMLAVAAALGLPGGSLLGVVGAGGERVVYFGTRREGSLWLGALARPPGGSRAAPTK